VSLLMSAMLIAWAGTQPVSAATSFKPQGTVTVAFHSFSKERYGNDSPLCPAAHNGDYANFGIMGSWGGERACDGVFIVFCCA
jgi:hypothetical protein